MAWRQASGSIRSPATVACLESEAAYWSLMLQHLVHVLFEDRRHGLANTAAATMLMYLGRSEEDCGATVAQGPSARCCSKHPLAMALHSWQPAWLLLS